MTHIMEGEMTRGGGGGGERLRVNRKWAKRPVTVQTMYKKTFEQLLVFPSLMAQQSKQNNKQKGKQNLRWYYKCP